MYDFENMPTEERLNRMRKSKSFLSALRAYGKDERSKKGQKIAGSIPKKLIKRIKRGDIVFSIVIFDENDTHKNDVTVHFDLYDALWTAYDIAAGDQSALIRVHGRTDDILLSKKEIAWLHNLEGMKDWSDDRCSWEPGTVTMDTHVVSNAYWKYEELYCKE